MNHSQPLFSIDPMNVYYNLDGLTDVILTCDVDWAPDFAIEAVYRMIAAFHFKLTIFATHRSDLLQRPPEFVEVGLHPDFTRQPPTGSFREKVANLLEYYPGSRGMRAHRNFFGQNISDIAWELGLTYDASIFLWNRSHCQCYIDYNGLLKYCYLWEDGIHLDTRTPLRVSEINLLSPGMKILNIHPILFYLNAPTDDYRREVTRKYRDLTAAPQSAIDPEIYRGRGIRTFYQEILTFLKESQVRTHRLGDLTERLARSGYSKRPQIEPLAITPEADQHA